MGRVETWIKCLESRWQNDEIGRLTDVWKGRGEREVKAMRLIENTGVKEGDKVASK